MDSNFLKFFREKIRTLEREIVKQIKEDTSCCGITLSQCHILLEVESKKEMFIKDLAKVMGLDKSTLSRTVESMVNSGLLKRDIKSSDRRSAAIVLTERGKVFASNINNICNEYYRKLFEIIPEDKHLFILDAISILSDAMSQLNSNAKKIEFCNVKDDT